MLSVLLVLLLGGLLFACIFAYYVKNTLTTDLNITLEDYAISLSSTVWAYDNNGQTVELAVLATDENRIWVDYDELPPYLEKAAVAIEDKRFYDHKGVDWYRTAGAFVNMFLGMKNDFGGSTITQQLIKNVTTEDDVTVQRKLVEIFRALDLEKEYTKEEIMEWYLNVVYFGEGASGVQMAANTYFGKDVRDLTLAQCASIIGITNNPSRYSPFASVENNKKRTKTILYEMYDQDYISHEEYTAAVAEVDNDELHFIRGENEVYQQEIYSYYVEMVIKDVLSDLQSRLGLSEAAARQLLYHGGYQIYACVDPFVQQVVDDIYTDPDSMPQPYYYSSQPLQSACMVIDRSPARSRPSAARSAKRTATSALTTPSTRTAPPAPRQSRSRPTARRWISALSPSLRSWTTAPISSCAAPTGTRATLEAPTTAHHHLGRAGCARRTPSPRRSSISSRRAFPLNTSPSAWASSSSRRTETMPPSLSASSPTA